MCDFKEVCKEMEENKRKIEDELEKTRKERKRIEPLFWERKLEENTKKLKKVEEKNR